MIEGKNIALFLDGTWNQVEDYTNIYLMYQLCEGIEVSTKPLTNDGQHNNIPQIKYYDPGVGTGLTKLSPVLIGGVLGLGLKHNVAQAYLTLCRHYKPGDRVFIYGFSRGAYTARTLSGLLNRFGVLRDECCKVHYSLPFWPFTAFSRQKDLKVAKKAVDKLRKSRHMDLKEQEELFGGFRRNFCKKGTKNGVEIEFMGMFDTVGSLGIPSILDPLFSARKNKEKSELYKKKGFLNRNKMPNVNFSRNVKNACHALAIDEYRLHFAPTLWNEIPVKVNVEQRWFAGAHSNVGGGYPDNHLSNKPLDWIYQQSRSHGLKLAKFMAPHDNVHLDEPISDSFDFFRKPYRLVGIREYYRPIFFKMGTDSQDESSLASQSIDESAFERIRFDTGYRTKNLMRLSDSDRKQLDSNKVSFDNKLTKRLRLLKKRQEVLAQGEFRALDNIDD